MTRVLSPHDRPIPGSYWLASVVAGLVVFVSFATTWWRPWFVENYTLLPGVGFGMLCAVVMTPVVWLAFRWPTFAIVVSLLPVLPLIFGDEGGFHFGVLAALAAVTITASWRRPRMAGVAAVLAIAANWWWIMSGFELALPFGESIFWVDDGHALGGAVIYSVAFVLILVGSLTMRILTLRGTVALEARSRELDAESTVLAERARLARDLHDVIAHHVSLIAVRAETAPYTDPDLDRTGRRILSEIAADARLALDELRGVLGILGRAGDAERAPQPTWGDIGALVERARKAGTEIRLSGDVAAATSAAAGYAAYRVVQEALTNARKHAPDARVSVDLEVTEQLLFVRVSNPARPGAASEPGNGLTGMRERVEALGGRLSITQGGGDFVVEATVPQEAPR
ncbi:sensor histidine kinase [Nocardioides limicola]|uniref:sensor histidine kinase n=1 Tax=Nocardioides limicola TaxID=2803368 RepID=UPI00193C5D0B|nr:histidine kinase [Nocardioides sp. DJM-14]